MMLIIGEIGKVSPTASCMHFQRNNLYIFCFLHRHSDLIYFCLNNPIYAIRLKLLVIWEKHCINFCLATPLLYSHLELSLMLFLFIDSWYQFFLIFSVVGVYFWLILVNRHMDIYIPRVFFFYHLFFVTFTMPTWTNMLCFWMIILNGRFWNSTV